MKKSIPFSLLVVFFLSFSACTIKQSVKITDKDFGEIVQQFQNLTFTFNHPVVPDSLLSRWDSVDYLKFEPRIHGKFMWIASDKLIFSPLDPFAPSTDYIVRIADDLTDFARERYIIDRRKISFHTPYLDLESVNAYWALSDEAPGKVEVRIAFGFSYDVDPQVLAGLLQVELKRDRIEYTVLTRYPARIIEIAMETADPESIEKHEVSLVIQAGLSCIGSTWVSPKAVTYHVSIPSKEELQITGMTPVWEKGMGSILVRTTQPVREDNLSGLVGIDPPVTFTVQAVRDGIRIEGEFTEGQSYKVTLEEEITGIFGKTLGRSYSQYITFSAIEPYIGFTESNAIYLASRGQRNLGVQIIHVPKVKLSVFLVFENNLAHYLRMGKRWDWMYEEGEYYDFYHYSFDNYYGQPVFTREVETSQLPRIGNARLLHLDLEELQVADTFKGVFLVKVESTEKKWLQDIRMVSLSDIGLIVREGIDDIYVFANSLQDASALDGVRVDFISMNNQVKYSAVTDNQGVVVFRNKNAVLPGAPVTMVTARKDNDFNFLIFNQTQVETSRFDVGGKRTQGSNYDVFIYGDRELYRPGDSVYMNTIVRTTHWKNVPEAPVKLRIVTPDGRDFLNLKKELNRQGAAESRFIIPQDAMTGSYSVEVYSGNDVLMGSSRFRVEEFMPDRIRVTTGFDKESYDPGDDIRMTIQATNLFGPPAANRNYEAELQLQTKTLQPKAHPNYSFQVNLPKDLIFSQILREGKTDSEGMALETFHIDEYSDIGIVEGRCYITVFDETGRPVNRLSQFDLYTQDIFYGIRDMDYWVDTRRPLPFHFVAVDRKGEKAGHSRAFVEVIHIRWETVIERSGSRYTYRSEKQESLMYSTQIDLDDGTAVFEFTPSVSGMYEVRIAPEQGGNYVSKEFYAYGPGDTDYTSFEVSREGQVLIETDKDTYEPGDKARVLVKAPFDGFLLVTLERGNVMDYRYVRTQDKAASLSFVITEQHLPNVYVSATAIRKTRQDNLPLTVAHGYKPLIVEGKNNKLDLSIRTVDESRSRTQQKIDIKTRPNAEVTVAMVDEGILLITDYTTPDPYGYFYQKRALEVNPYDLYAWLYPELRAERSSFGGGEGYDLGKRINPLANKRVKLVSMWSGILKADARGNCSFTADIPSFSGSLRVMAVAYKDHQFASAEHSIRVSDPIVISTALPRFLSPGDLVDMPVMVSNTTDKKAKTEVSVALNGPLRSSDKLESQVEIPANSEEQVLFKIAAEQAIGQGGVTVDVRAFGETFSEEVQIPVRPSAGLQKLTGSGAVNGGETKTFSVKTDFLPASTSSHLILSKSPVVEFTRNLTQLIGYPYGCIEQTVSRAFPLLYYQDLAVLLVQDKKNIGYNPGYLVQEAIRKIYSMQRYDGGILFWPGGDRVSWWGTAYAAHFLTEAQKAGFSVDPKILDQMLKYINAQAKDKETEEYYFREASGNYFHKQMAKREIFYSLYVLALNGAQNISLMNHYKPLSYQLTDDSQYLLATAYLLTGDEASYRQLLPAGMGRNQSQRAFSGSFYSHTRDLAIILSTLLDVDPDNPQIPVFSRALSQELKQQRWLSTQESSFALCSLGKLSGHARKSTVQARVTIDGSEAGRFEGNDLIIRKDMNNKQVTIEATEQGVLYYSYEVDGISASGRFTEEDNYLEARRAFFTRNGMTVTNLAFEQNDLVVVRISIRSTLLSTVENVAITDILPACFEIENPRISPGRELSWIKDRTYPDYLDIRDDRLSIFTTATKEWKHFYYLVRVVSKGEYRMGPVSADAMYNGEYHSYNGGGMVFVR